VPLVLAAFAVLAITTVIVLVLGVRCSAKLSRASANADTFARRASDLEAKVGELERELDSLHDDWRQVVEEAAAVQAELAQSERDRQAAETSAAAAASRGDELEASLALANYGVGPPGETGTLELLLARVERQWAEALGVGPDERGVRAGVPGDQVAQALGRELERVKEEVGVETKYVVTPPLQITDPTAFILASGEVIAVLASGCQQVQAELNSGLVLIGRGWDGSLDDLGDVMRRAAAAGLTVEPLDVSEGQLRLTLR
jgi:hypothetical protein